MSTIGELLKPCCSRQDSFFKRIECHHPARRKAQDLAQRRSTRWAPSVRAMAEFDQCASALDRRSVLLEAAAVAAVSFVSNARRATADEEPNKPDTTITHKVYLDVGLCQQNSQNRTLGDNAFCKEPQQLGRIVLGLYGNLVPATVNNFLALMKSGNYNNTLFNKVLPGEFISAGKQGSARMGEVALTAELLPNKDLMAARSYDLDHQRAGTVSLNLSRSEDEPALQQSRAYRNVSFLITTGPGPASSLDGTNVVFGKVLQGMDTVARVTAVPTFKPVNDRLLALNRLGSMLGDERADKTRKKWGRPLKPVLITDTGILN